MMRKAIFFDRDGVLIEDVGLVSDTQDIRLLEGVPFSLHRLKNAGYLLFIVSNQPIIARGIVSEEKVIEINGKIEEIIMEKGGPGFDGIEFCPHHPNATLDKYRFKCDCRKPEPGMILRLAKQFHVDLKNSFLVGDRITDIIAGRLSGCKTILLQTGKHLDQPIMTWEPVDTSIEADYVCKELMSATDLILGLEKCVQ
jgi:D-glycero-D-manno-heptose 1,7-bisphosphate phosphatase